MIEHILFLQAGGFFGGDLGGLLASWEQAGVFSYLLPFLLIFAIVFGILSKIKVFGDNRGLNAVIAFVVGLLALQFNLVPVFFSDIFPRVGVALSVILALLIIAGLFFDPDNKAVNYGLLFVGVIIFVVVLAQTLGDVGGFSTYWFYSHWQEILGAVIFLGLIGAVIGSANPKTKSLPDYKALAFR